MNASKIIKYSKFEISTFRLTDDRKDLYIVISDEISLSRIYNLF